MKITTYKTRILKEKENLASFIFEHIKEIKDKSVLAVSSKILALSLGLTKEIKTEREFEALIKTESDKYLKTEICYFTIRGGMVMTNGGIDRSNANGKVVLLPKNIYAEAKKLRSALLKKYKIKNLGLIFTDSMILPLRSGVIGAAVGYAGFKGVKNYIGKKDIFGRKLEMTLLNTADSLAAAASLNMGEGAERTPLAIIENAPIVFSSKTNEREMKYPFKKDLYYPFFKNLLK